MTFDFDKLIDRTQTGSVKWSPRSSSGTQPLPMWVADMDFRSPAPVLEALHQAVDHGIFGYDKPLAGFYEAVIDWHTRRHHWTPRPEWMLLTPGVVAALFHIIQTFSRPGDSVLMQMPVYHPFHAGTVDNGRHVIGVPLEAGADGRYVFDPDRFRRAIQPNTRLFILCHPHNPVGKVWSAEELRTMGEICLERGVLVVSDEIHQDFVLNPEMRHLPFASLGGELANNCIVCSAPSKTFNLAGLRLSHVFVPNPRLRGGLQRTLERTGAKSANTFGPIACEAAYRHGAPWLDALLDYLRGNHARLAESLKTNVPEISVSPADSLYLAWLDCRRLRMTPDQLNAFMLNDVGLWLNRGDEFGAEGAGFMRMNLGCPRQRLDEALSRLKIAVSDWRENTKRGH